MKTEEVSVISSLRNLGDLILLGRRYRNVLSTADADGIELRDSIYHANIAGLALIGQVGQEKALELWNAFKIEREEVTQYSESESCEAVAEWAIWSFLQITLVTEILEDLIQREKEGEQITELAQRLIDAPDSFLSDPTKGDRHAHG